jgi:hypothetical protein
LNIGAVNDDTIHLPIGLDGDGYSLRPVPLPKVASL